MEEEGAKGGGIFPFPVKKMEGKNILLIIQRHLGGLLDGNGFVLGPGGVS